MINKDDVLAYLKNNSGYCKVKDIAYSFSVSPRTIQNKISELKKEGYKIEQTQNGIKYINDSTQKESEHIYLPQNYEQRKMWILRKCLFNNEILPFSFASNYLGISDSTLSLELNKLKKELSQYKIRLAIKNDNIIFIGSNHYKKAYISLLTYQESGNNILTTQRLNDYFPSYDASKIKEILLNNLYNQNYYIDDFSLMNVILHILVCMQINIKANVKLEVPISVNINQLYEINPHYVNLVAQIVDDLQKEYNVTFSQDDYTQIYFLLTTRISKEDDDSHLKSVESFTDERTNHLLNIIIKKVQNVYSINLNINTFKIGFSLHMHNLLIRLDTKTKVHNPLLQEIKITEPFIYDIAIFVSSIIMNETGLTMNDDEISYIALHIGTSLHEIRLKSEKLDACIVCPNFYTSVGKQIQTIPHFFSNSIYVSSIVANENEIPFKTPDLIITTIPLENFHNDGIIKISMFLTDNDIEKINQTILVKKQLKNKNAELNLLNRLFPKELFTIQETSYNSYGETLKSICDTMVSHKYVESDYYSKLLDREKISSTVFGSVAIPHPVNYYSIHTIMSVTILKKPIVFNKNKIKLIFCITISKEDFLEFQKIFSFLTSICMDGTCIDLLINSKNYNEFIENIFKLYNKQTIK